MLNCKNTNRSIFDSTWERARRIREILGFRYLQSSLPRPPASEQIPGWYNLNRADLLLAILLRLPEEEWQNYNRPVILGGDGEATKTGDPVVDAWEKELLGSGGIITDGRKATPDKS